MKKQLNKASLLAPERKTEFAYPICLLFIIAIL